MKKVPVKVIKYLSILLAMIMILVPLYIVFAASLKTKTEFAVTSKMALPENILNLKNYLTVFEKGKIGLGFFNTGFILFFSLIGNVLLGTMAAYALQRFDFKLKKLVISLYTVSVIIPAITTQVATFSIISGLHLSNTRWSVILLYLGTDLVQLNIYLQFLRSIPYELDEAAIVEGASLFKVFRSVILPLLKPAITTVVIIKSIGIYNDVYLPYLYMPSQKYAVISTSLMRFMGSISADWNVLSAAAVVVMIPMIIVYLLLQKYIFSGITGGAVKG